MQQNECYAQVNLYLLGKEFNCGMRQVAWYHIRLHGSGTCSSGAESDISFYVSKIFALSLMFDMSFASLLFCKWALLFFTVTNDMMPALIIISRAQKS